MPALDPTRYVHCSLRDPSHILPMPNRRVFLPEGQLVDLHDPFIAMLIATRSIVPTPAASPPDPVPVAAVPPSPPASNASPAPAAAAGRD